MLIEHRTVLSANSDFMPVAQKVKAAGRTLIGIGNRKNTNRHWAKSCYEFRYYDALVEAPATEEEQKTSEAKYAPPPAPLDPPAEMLKRAVQLLAETKGEAWVNKGSVWHIIK